MTLHETVKHFRWDTTHDYHHPEWKGDTIVAIYGLGLYEEDLARLKSMVPSITVTELRRIESDAGVWLRVDVKEGP